MHRVRLKEGGDDVQVGKVQRQFVMRMLGQSSFTRHLSAVRETNSLLMRALELRTKDDGNSVKVACPCMCSCTLSDTIKPGCFTLVKMPHMGRQLLVLRLQRTCVGECGVDAGE